MSRRGHSTDRPPAARSDHVEQDPTTRQTRRPLFRSLGVSVVDFRCRAGVEAQGREEPNATHSIVFVRRGVFTRTDCNRTLVADPNQILFFNEGQPYRYAHPVPGGDDCTILMLDDECARAATETIQVRRSRDSRRPFPLGHAPATPRAAWLHHELLAMECRATRIGDLALQDIVAELIDESMLALSSMPSTPGPEQLARTRRRETVEAAKLMLSQRLEAPPSLIELASALDCSPFHLSRMFRAGTGLGLRHYLRRLRVRLAAERLRRGAHDLTSLALDLGFYDHSHLTNAFRREWGVPPSRIRRAIRTGRIARRR